MAQKINPVPKGYRSATPALVMQNAAAAIDYYAHVFGATEMSRIHNPDGLAIQRAEIRIGNSVVHLSDEMPAYGILSPLSLGGACGSVQLYLDDITAVWERAVEAGATIVLPLEDTYWGERTGRIVDPYGHVWNLSQRIEAVSKKELNKRVAELFGTQSQAESQQEDDRDEIPTVDIRLIELDANAAGQQAVETAAG